MKNSIILQPLQGQKTNCNNKISVVHVRLLRKTYHLHGGTETTGQSHDHKSNDKLEEATHFYKISDL